MHRVQNGVKLDCVAKIERVLFSRQFSTPSVLEHAHKKRLTREVAGEETGRAKHL